MPRAPFVRYAGLAGSLLLAAACPLLPALRGDGLLHAGYALAATVVLAPVFHPWYATWPLAVLAATVKRETLWLVVPPVAAAVLCLPDGYNLALATRAQGAVLMTAGLVYLAWKAIDEGKKDRTRRLVGAGGDRDRLSRRDA